MTRKELLDNIRRKKSGLDTDIKKIPEHLKNDADAIFKFNKAIIDATAPYCVAYKPNLAFYECFGIEGWTALEKTIKYLKQNYPDQFIIADAKRGDIGNTSAMYARSFFEHLDVDAITVAPYMGEDSISPFYGYEGKWVIVLGLTSNKGSHDFQLTEDADGTPLYQNVMSKVSSWGTSDNTMFVVGATQGKMFEEVRRVVPDKFLLVPGVGAQGGSLEEVARYGMTDDFARKLLTRHYLRLDRRRFRHRCRTESKRTASANGTAACRQRHYLTPTTNFNTEIILYSKIFN